jgi:hypothetical protein
MNRRANSADVIVLCVGMNIACLESQSMMTRMESKPVEEGSFLMKSIEIEFQGRSGIGSCLRFR